MEQATEARTYSSPHYKLIGSFRKSRDGWTRKAKDRNVRIKRLNNRVGFGVQGCNQSASRGLGA